MASLDPPDTRRGGSLPVSLSIGGIVAVIVAVATVQSQLPSKDDVADIRLDHERDTAAIEARLDQLNQQGTRGLGELRGELQGRIEALDQRIADKTADRHTGKDFRNHDRRYSERFARIEADIDRLRVALEAHCEERSHGRNNGFGTCKGNGCP